MPDPHEQIRSLPFPALARALGLDIERYKTRKAGKEYFGPCPVHKPKNNTTSFSYNADGRFQCFSCSAKGKGALDLVKAVQNVGFKDAVAFLEPLKSYEPPKEKSSPGDDSRAKPVDLTKYRRFVRPCEWLEKRIPDAAIRERYGVFYYQNDSRKSAFNRRVMIPVKSETGELAGYLGRNIQSERPDDVPKYIFPKGLEKSKFLFGAHEILAGTFGPAPLRVCYLLESPFAVMKYASLGLPAVSPFGWSLSGEQCVLLSQIAKGVVYLPDANKRADAAQQLPALCSRMWAKFPELPAGIDDPENLSLEQIKALTVG